ALESEGEPRGLPEKHPGRRSRPERESARRRRIEVLVPHRDPQGALPIDTGPGVGLDPEVGAELLANDVALLPRERGSSCRCAEQQPVRAWFTPEQRQPEDRPSRRLDLPEIAGVGWAEVFESGNGRSVGQPALRD